MHGITGLVPAARKKGREAAEPTIHSILRIAGAHYNWYITGVAHFKIVIKDREPSLLLVLFYYFTPGDLEQNAAWQLKGQRHKLYTTF